jgi:hypothetical protein
LVIVVREGKFQEVGKRGEDSISQGAEVIDAKSLTAAMLPDLNLIKEGEQEGFFARLAVKP